MTFTATLPIEQKFQNERTLEALLPFLQRRSMVLPVADDKFYVIPLGESTDANGITYGASLGYIPANGIIPDHTHTYAHAIVHILQGEGQARHGTNSIPYKPGMAFDIPSSLPHGFKAKTETLFYATQKNNGVIGDDGAIDMTLL